MKLKLNWKIVIISVLALLLSLLAVLFVLHREPKVVPEELLAESLEKSLGSGSYRYHVKATLFVDDRERQLSDITGEKTKSGDFHIKGSMQEQKVEVYQIDGTTYIMDPVSGRWMTIPGNKVFQQPMFMVEINPLASFNYNGTEPVEYLGVEEVKGRKAYVLSCIPQTVTKFLEMNWEQFQYKVWVDKRSHLMLKAEIEGVHKGNARDRLVVEVEVSDYNQEINLEPPVA